MHQLNAMTPSSSNSQSQAQRLQWLQLQQQFLFNQNQLSGNMPVPAGPLNVQNFQQVLNQQLAHFQKQHQQLLMQQAKIGNGGGMSSSQHHQINLKLKQTQQSMQQINNQLAVIAQLSSSASSTGVHSCRRPLLPRRLSWALSSVLLRCHHNRALE